jgi:hypothetical protein
MKTRIGDRLYGVDFAKGRLSAEQRQRLILPNHALHAAVVRFRRRGQPRLFQCEREQRFSEFAPRVEICIQPG